jgi:hypothetical protein
MTGKEHTNHPRARKGARPQSQPTSPAARASRPAALLKSCEQLGLPEGLHRRLTREALGDNGSVESFVLLLLVIDAAVKAGDTVTAQNLLFRSLTHAYENSNYHVTALMDFRDCMRQKADALPRAEAGEGCDHG